MGTRNSRSLHLYAGRESHPMEDTIMKLTSSSVNEHTAVDNIEYEYDRLVDHLHICTIEAKTFKNTKRRLSPRTLELIRQRGDIRATDNHELTSHLTKQHREATKEDLGERRSAALAEAADAAGVFATPIAASAVVKQKRVLSEGWRL
ncbi:hypothetical protein RB195_023757 [Necator americanus]|uniref:Uncharacterized protein n=1 Tax=Necator americanus TaxID=51031 RepID=A0ABR1EKJ4_NECAM